jgi:hypothetical protein
LLHRLLPQSRNVAAVATVAAQVNRGESNSHQKQQQQQQQFDESSQ